MPASGLRSWLLQAWKDRPRRRQMIVTDITRMEGDRVCVGGYLDDGTAIRPVAGRTGPDERWLRSARDAPVVPFAVLELQVNRAPKRLAAPHTEDRTIPGKGHRVLRVLPDAERIALLERSLSPSVRAIFAAEVHADSNGQWGRYVRSGEGSRSLGTIRAGRIQSVHYRFYAERKRWDYRLRFVDEAGEVFQLAVVDLAFRGRLDRLRDAGATPEVAARATHEALQSQSVLLRIGLARGWERHPDRCYLQITGVYGFSW
ncbi:MAG: dual OB domain-containing protein [Thermomicrobiales bacterium]